MKKEFEESLKENIDDMDIAEPAAEEEQHEETVRAEHPEAAISAILFAPVLTEYLRTGMVPRFPTLIVSGFLSIAAILSLFSGLILQTMLHKNRQDFEMQLIRLHEQFEALCRARDGVWQTSRSRRTEPT